MKNLIKELLKEASGVPTGIHEAASIIYDEIVKTSENKLSEGFLSKVLNFLTPNKKEKQIKFDINLKDKNVFIGDMRLKDVYFFLNLTENTNTEEILFNGAKVKWNYAPIFNVYFYFTVPPKVNKYDIINRFDKNKDLIIYVISHELKHLYDYYKKEHKNIHDVSKYTIYNLLTDKTSNMYIDVLPIKDFLHMLYYITNTENLVRPSELYSYAKSNGITKKTFYNFFINSDQFKYLKKIENFTYGDLIDQMLNHIADIEKYLNTQKINYNNMNDNEKISEVLRSLYYNIANKRIYSYSDSIYTSNPMIKPLEQLFGLKPEKQKKLDNLVKDAKKFKNNIRGFYDYEIKNMNKDARNMIKKLSGVYSLLD